MAWKYGLDAAKTTRWAESVVSPARREISQSWKKAENHKAISVLFCTKIKATTGGMCGLREGMAFTIKANFSDFYSLSWQ
jgi:hypothetical protein